MIEVSLSSLLQPVSAFHLQGDVLLLMGDGIVRSRANRPYDSWMAVARDIRDYMVSRPSA